MRNSNNIKNILSQVKTHLLKKKSNSIKLKMQSIMIPSHGNHNRKYMIHRGKPTRKATKYAKDTIK